MTAQVPGDTFKREFFGREVEGWLGRANDQDKERFERVFETIRSIAESKKAPDEHADFVHSTLNKIKSRTSSAATPGRPPLAPSSSPSAPKSWTYTATRAALDRPDSTVRASTLRQQHTQYPQQSPQHGEPGEAAAARPPASSPTTTTTPSSGRPHSAPGNRDLELTSFDQAAARRRAISFGMGSRSAGANSPTTAEREQQAAAAGAATAAVAAAVAAAAAAAADRPAANPMQSTTYGSSYNLSAMYPEVYDAALKACRAEPAPNYTLISAWGDSMKTGADASAKAFMRTTYASTNDEVHPGRSATDELREREFFKWMRKQRTYYGDLLARAQREDLESFLEVANDEQKRDILQALRQVHAVVDPDQVRSHSQTVHCDMAPTDDTELRQKLKEHTRVRTMGGTHVLLRKQGEADTGAGAAGARARRPHSAMAAMRSSSASALELKPTTVDLTFGEGAAGGGRLKPTRRPATAHPAAARKAAAAAASQSLSRSYTTAGAEKDTFRSKVPLQWAAAAGPLMSSYVDHYGGLKVDKPRPSSALYRSQQVKYKEVTCPFGAVNAHTAMAPERGGYAVPDSFLTTSLTNGPHAFPQRPGMTTYRGDFAQRDAQDVARSIRAAQELTEQSHKALLRSTLPLGRNAPDLVPPSQWISEMKDEYIERPGAAGASLRANVEQADGLRAMFTGPTASVGKVATLREFAGRP